MDILAVIDFVYNDGPEPANMEASDVDNSGSLNLVDILVIIDFIYNDGPEPSCQ